MRVEGLVESFVGKSSLCVDGCAAPGASLAPFVAGLAGGCGPSLACTASPESVAEGVAVAICVPFGRSETVRKALGSGNCGAAAGDAANGGATTGVLTTETGGPEDAPAVDCAAPADVGVKFVAAGALPSEA